MRSSISLLVLTLSQLEALKSSSIESIAAPLRAGSPLPALRHVLRQDYLRGWFTVDLLATLPIDYMLMAMGENADAETARNLRVLRMLRLARCARRTSYLGRLPL